MNIQSCSVSLLDSRRWRLRRLDAVGGRERVKMRRCIEEIQAQPLPQTSSCPAPLASSQSRDDAALRGRAHGRGGDAIGGGAGPRDRRRRGDGAAYPRPTTLRGVGRRAHETARPQSPDARELPGRLRLCLNCRVLQRSGTRSTTGRTGKPGVTTLTNRSKRGPRQCINQLSARRTVDLRTALRVARRRLVARRRQLGSHVAASVQGSPGLQWHARTACPPTP